MSCNLINTLWVLPGLVVGACLAATSSSSAQDTRYSFSTFTVPGAESAFPTGIDNQGQIVGDFYVCCSGKSLGFVRSPAGSLVTVRYPGSTLTRVTGINNRGSIVGYEERDDPSNGHILSSDGFTHTIDQPVNALGLPLGSIAAGLNRLGSVVGYSVVDGANENAFLRDLSGHYTMINFVSPNFPAPDTTQPMGMNDLGAIVGWFSNGNRQYGFIRYQDGSYGEIAPPVPFSNLTPRAINNYGVIVGVFVYPPAFSAHGFIRDSFGVLTPIDVSGAGSTNVSGINDHGVIVGTYADAKGIHLFIGTPLPQ
jgi:hypothetical protein